MGVTARGWQGEVFLSRKRNRELGGWVARIRMRIENENENENDGGDSRTTMTGRRRR